MIVLRVCAVAWTLAVLVILYHVVLVKDDLLLLFKLRLLLLDDLLLLRNDLHELLVLHKQVFELLVGMGIVWLHFLRLFEKDPVLLVYDG